MVGACLRAGRNVLLEGPVGVGKTALLGGRRMTAASCAWTATAATGRS